MNHIAPYILKSEYRCSHCKRLPPDFHGNETSMYHMMLFENFKEIREEFGKPIPITSGYRCPIYQKDLYDQGVSSAILSVHIFGLALDLDCKDEIEVMRLLGVIEGINSDLRVGWKRYLNRGQSFIHIDLGYLIKPCYDEKLMEGARW